MATMTDPIPSAGETTIIGLPAITVPVTSTGDRPLTKGDLETIMRLADGTALLISTRGAVSGSRYLLDEDEITVGRDPRADILLDDSTVSRAHAVFRRSDRKISHPQLLPIDSELSYFLVIIRSGGNKDETW